MRDKTQQFAIFHELMQIVVIVHVMTMILVNYHEFIMAIHAIIYHDHMHLP